MIRTKVHRCAGDEVKQAGLATHYLPSFMMPEVRQRLQQLGPQAADLSVVDTALKALEVCSQARAFVQIIWALDSMAQLVSRCL
jgi:3-hydroxyisobutyryl-CoA hydrolase